MRPFARNTSQADNPFAVSTFPPETSSEPGDRMFTISPDGAPSFDR
jgi:hypothetical protein